MSAWFYGLPCWFCGGDATSRDHLIPKSKGGVEKNTLLVPACQFCNDRKGMRTVREFRSFIRNTPIISPQVERIREQGYRFYGELTGVPSTIAYPKGRCHAPSGVSLFSMQPKIRTPPTESQ